MDTQLQAIRDQQKETWNKFSGGWKKWNDFTMIFLKPMGDAIIAALDIKENDVVLILHPARVSQLLQLLHSLKMGRFMQLTCLIKCSMLHANMPMNTRLMDSLF